MTRYATQQAEEQAEALALDLAALGYPGFAHLRARPCAQMPAQVVLTALSQADLECRIVEALPWVLLAYPELDWTWLRDRAQRQGLQNRLGFITNVARRLAEQQDEREKAALLVREEAALEQSRLLREDTLCHASLTQAERRYLLEHRPAAAIHWRLLTDMEPEHLVHACA
jgi:hypothetical protein